MHRTLDDLIFTFQRETTTEAQATGYHRTEQQGRRGGRSAGRGLRMGHRFRGLFGAVLGGGTGQVVRRAVCGDYGKLSRLVGHDRLVDSGHFVRAVFGAGAGLECAVSTVLLSGGRHHRRGLLQSGSGIELLCNEFGTFAVHVWSVDGDWGRIVDDPGNRYRVAIL